MWLLFCAQRAKKWSLLLRKDHFFNFTIKVYLAVRNPNRLGLQHILDIIQSVEGDERGSNQQPYKKKERHTSGSLRARKE